MKTGTAYTYNPNYDVRLLLEHIVNNTVTPEDIEDLISFYWDFDPYGILDAWGHIGTKKASSAVRKEIKYLLENDKKELIEVLETEIEEQED